MPLRKPWKSLDRSTIGSVPDRYGMFELGDADGTVIAIDHGPLRDSLKEALAYGDGSNVRWEVTQTPEQAAELASTHRNRLEG